MFLFRRPPSLTSAPDEIYSSCLATLYQGHALWYPEPHASGEPQIGDVGFVHRGAFIRLFNLDTSASEKKVVFWDPPFKVTEPLPPGVLKLDPRRRPLVPAHYHSHGVEIKQRSASADIAPSANVSATLSAEYACNAAQGAILELKSEADAESIFENVFLKKYIVRHHGEWFAYAKGVLGHDIKWDSIVVVIGWVKTEADWATVALSNTSTSSSVSFKGQAGGIAGLGVGASRASSVTGPTVRRQGKNYSANANAPNLVANAPNLIPAEPERDQSVFVRRYKMQRRLGILREVVAGAGYHRLPDAGGGRGGSAAEGIMAQEVGDIDETDIIELESEGEVPDPLDVLLDYILETSNVETAIASDDDVWSIVGGKSVVDFASYLRRMQPPVEVDGAVGSLCMEDVISHERALAFARWTITASDLAEWPHATVDGAGRLEDAHVFTGSSNADMRSLKLKRLTFADSQDPSRGCECFTLSADGKLLAASFRSNDVLVWRLSEGLLVQRLHHQDHEYEVTALSVSPVDYTLVSGSDDGTAIVWDTRRGRVLLRLEGHGGPVSNIIHDHHGALIATGSDDDKSVKIWDASSGVCLHSFGIDDEIYRLTFLPDNSYLYAELKTSHKIYDIRTYTRTITLQHIAGFSPVSRQGDRIVTGAHWDAPGQVKIWSAATGEELLTIDPPKKLSIPVAFSSDGAEVVAACDADTAVVAYDSRTGQLRRIFKLGEPAFCAVYSPDGEYVAFGVRGGKDVELYDAKSGAFLAKFDGQEESGNIRDIQFPPHSHTLLARFGDGRLLLYDIQDVLRMR